MNFVIETKNFSLRQTILSGQFFRFYELKPNFYLIFANNNSVEVSQDGNLLIFKNSTCDKNFWLNYFDLNVDYSKFLFNFLGDSVLELAVKFCGGIRILNQNPLEVLVCFLFSSCNNILRIKKIVHALCVNFGTKIANVGFAFPTLNQLKLCNLSNLEVLKAGFRTPYLIDAIKKIFCGSLNLNDLGNLDVDEARKQLMQIKGVGRKIADCVLLFAYHKFEVFPLDVWMKRVVKQYYNLGLSKQILSCPGFAQQLLYYSKMNGII